MEILKVERLPMRIVTPSTQTSRHTAISNEKQVSLTAPAAHVVLSLADMALPPFFYVSMLFAFQAAAAVAVCRLEDALRQVLLDYGEFAGAYGQDPSGQPCLHLTSQGVAFFEARAPTHSLNDGWHFQPDVSMVSLLPPYAEQLLGIQVTTFACGGISLGVVCNHQVADGEGLCQLMEAWAATVRGEAIPCAPCHVRSALIGPRTWEPIRTATPPVWKVTGALNYEDPVIRKRLCIDGNRVKEIKAQVEAGPYKYSTFVSVLSRVWKCIMVAQGLDKEDKEGESNLTFAVSLRKRMVPELPKGYFGNAVCHVYPKIKIKDLVSKPLAFTARIVHDAIEEVNRKAATLPPSDVVHPIPPKERPKVTTSPRRDFFVATWSWLPFYDVDFGGGPPLFAGNPFEGFPGIVYFTPSLKRDGGIVVELALLPPWMQKFESLF
ncbi:hypothetical protein GOP47_0013341 [Adiantum capillus-veneris]|uniref:Uncharacterized protein n=1 Tax=Adiantum capillus-veneris TaxID=13818 RepID=A0A9D4UNJ9_ADICA|nr:hypothetical protein GOP47_0013341 [Adiantum capillus-veneris]